LTPNPTNGQVQLTLNKPINQTLRVSATHIEGKMVFTTIISKSELNNESFVLNLSDLRSGVYAVSVNSENKLIQTNKLIKIKNKK